MDKYDNVLIGESFSSVEQYQIILQARKILVTQESKHIGHLNSTLISKKQITEGGRSEFAVITVQKCLLSISRYNYALQRILVNVTAVWLQVCALNHLGLDHLYRDWN